VVIAARAGGHVDRITWAPGEIHGRRDRRRPQGQKYKLLALVHAEIFTGAEQLHIAIAAAATNRRIDFADVDLAGGIPVGSTNGTSTRLIPPARRI
jgi:hypothetical protein